MKKFFDFDLTVITKLDGVINNSTVYELTYIN